MSQGRSSGFSFKRKEILSFFKTKQNGNWKEKNMTRRAGELCPGPFLKRNRKNTKQRKPFEVFSLGEVHYVKWMLSRPGI